MTEIFYLGGMTYGKLTGEDTPTHWSHHGHDQDCDGHEPGHLVLMQRGQGEQSSRQVEHERGDHGPQEDAVPHLCNTDRMWESQGDSDVRFQSKTHLAVV